jgi:hypothetical protein
MSLALPEPEIYPRKDHALNAILKVRLLSNHISTKFIYPVRNELTQKESEDEYENLS